MYLLSTDFSRSWIISFLFSHWLELSSSSFLPPFPCQRCENGCKGLLKRSFRRRRPWDTSLVTPWVQKAKQDIEGGEREDGFSPVKNKRRNSARKKSVGTVGMPVSCARSFTGCMAAIFCGVIGPTPRAVNHHAGMAEGEMCWLAKRGDSHFFPRCFGVGR